MQRKNISLYIMLFMKGFVMHKKHMKGEMENNSLEIETFYRVEYLPIAYEYLLINLFVYLSIYIFNHYEVASCTYKVV